VEPDCAAVTSKNWPGLKWFEEEKLPVNQSRWMNQVRRVFDGVQAYQVLSRPEKTVGFMKR
jgi:hypothetical protein